MEKEMNKFDTILESLWANINKKRKSGRKSAKKGSKAYKAGKKSGDKLHSNKMRKAGK